MNTRFDDEDSDSSTRSGPPVYTISQATELIRATLADGFSGLWLSAELSEVSRPSSGHIYLTLKDEAAQMRAVVWRSTAARLKFEPREGTKVLVCGDIDVYPPRGSYQLVVRQMEPLGVGALQLAFQQLHAKLAAEGLFDPARKRPLPEFPRRIAFVTSPSGAAVRDFLQIALRRWSGIQFLVIPAKVQGEGASDDIAAGIAAAHRLDPRPDVLVVGRGGGSLEDLWAFNEEKTVRAIAASEIPTVSAVGHEIDVTLADLAADLRALTPSDAAQRIVPSAEDLKLAFEGISLRMRKALVRKSQLLRERTESLASRRVFRAPFDRVRLLSQRCDELQARSLRGLKQRLHSADVALRTAAARLEGLSPLAVFARGYSVTTLAANGALVRTTSDAPAGTKLITRVSDGTITSIVE